MDKDNLLIYIKFLKGCKNVKGELLFKNIYGIIVDTVLKDEGNDMKIIVNIFYKKIKKYKLCIKEILSPKEMDAFGTPSPKEMDDLCCNVLDSSSLNKVDIVNSNYIISYNILKFKKLNIDIIRYVLHILYNEDIISDNDIINWYNNLGDGSEYKKSVLLKDFVEWVKETT